MKKAIADPRVLRNDASIVGGGDVNKLVEVKPDDIVRLVNPQIEDVIDERVLIEKSSVGQE